MPATKRKTVKKANTRTKAAKVKRSSGSIRDLEAAKKVTGGKSLQPCI